MNFSPTRFYVTKPNNGINDMEKCQEKMQSYKSKCSLIELLDLIHHCESVLCVTLSSMSVGLSADACWDVRWHFILDLRN